MHLPATHARPVVNPLFLDLLHSLFRIPVIYQIFIGSGIFQFAGCFHDLLQKTQGFLFHHRVFAPGILILVAFGHCNQQFPVRVREGSFDCIRYLLRRMSVHPDLPPVDCVGKLLDRAGVFLYEALLGIVGGIRDFSAVFAD